ARAERDYMMAVLTSLRTAEEWFFTDHDRYTDEVAELGRFGVPDGRSVSLAVGPGVGWSATIESRRLPDIQCGMAVGPRAVNPVDHAAGEGEPVCATKK